MLCYAVVVLRLLAHIASESALYRQQTPPVVC